MLDSLVQHGLVTIGERHSLLTGGAVTEYKTKEPENGKQMRSRYPSGQTAV